MLGYPQNSPHRRVSIITNLEFYEQCRSIHKCLAAVVVLGLSLTGTAQQNNPSLPRSKPQAAATTSPAKLTREQKFVIDTVKMAVALPESDPQDRLRVLSTAADVVSAHRQKDGARILE